MTFNGKPYAYFQGNPTPQWVREVKESIRNPEIKLVVDLGGLLREDGWTTMDVFQAAAKRGKVGWANGPGTDWEMRAIQLAAYGDDGLAGRIRWFNEGKDVTDEMAGLSLLPPGER